MAEGPNSNAAREQRMRFQISLCYMYIYFFHVMVCATVYWDEIQNAADSMPEEFNMCSSFVD